MDKRLTNADPERDKDLRKALYTGVQNNELTIAQAVKLMQRASKLTQPEFAQHRGISLQALRQITSGIANPTVETLNKIADVYGLEVGFVPKRPPR